MAPQNALKRVFHHVPKGKHEFFNNSFLTFEL